MSNTKWGIWVIGENASGGDPAGHWYRITSTSLPRSFNSIDKAERHKRFLDHCAERFERNSTHSVEEFEDEHTKPCTRKEKLKIWKKGIGGNFYE